MKKSAYNTEILSDIYPTLNSFLEDHNNLVPALKVLTTDQATITYYLLLGRYANSPIYTTDTDQFKVKLLTVIYEYGKLYFARRDIQEKIMAITDEEASKGTKAIYNQANNPNEAPTTESLEEIEYINQQNTTGYKYSKLESLERKYNALRSDATEDFLKKFLHLFLLSIYPQKPILYLDEDDDEEDD